MIPSSHIRCCHSAFACAKITRFAPFLPEARVKDFLIIALVQRPSHGLGCFQKAVKMNISSPARTGPRMPVTEIHRMRSADVGFFTPYHGHSDLTWRHVVNLSDSNRRTENSHHHRGLGHKSLRSLSSLRKKISSSSNSELSAWLSVVQFSHRELPPEPTKSM